MKIKTQFSLFIFGAIFVPLVCMLTIPAYHYLTRPERILMSGYKQINKMGELSLSERDFDMLIHTLRGFPPEVEMIYVVNHSTVLMSTIPELKNYKTIDDKTLFNFIRQTSNHYFYQMVTPSLESNDADILLVSRILREKDPGSKMGKQFKGPNDIWHNLKYPIIMLAIFIIFCVVMIIHLSTTISKSITMLEENTHKIADGDLDVALVTPNDSNSTNEITRLIDNLERMRQALREANERKSRFIMGISHDLRTPVAVIKGYVEAIGDGMVTTEEELKKAMEIIATKNSQLETMINTLINFVKLNSTDWRSQLKKQPVKSFLKEYSENAIVAANVFKRNVSSNLAISDTTEAKFDYQLFTRALENLMSNAIRYTKDGDNITISGQEDNKYIYVSLADTGTGMDEKEQQHIFEMFYRGTNSRREVGMGIGLSVVKNIVDTHGWKIKVESKKNQGTTFTIIIPKV